MTLFGPAPSPPRAAWPPPPLPSPRSSQIPRAATTAAEEANPAGKQEIPAFERRARLRRERHRLVSEVTRREHTSQRDVNAWANRQVGIAGVDKATLRELERSIELLVDRLNARR
jgi:hypothetical protein